MKKAGRSAAYIFVGSYCHCVGHRRARRVCRVEHFPPGVIAWRRVPDTAAHRGLSDSAEARRARSPAGRKAGLTRSSGGGLGRRLHIMTAVERRDLAEHSVSWSQTISPTAHRPNFVEIEECLMTPGKKCAHKACECEVAAGQQYCSRQCEQ